MVFQIAKVVNIMDDAKGKVCSLVRAKGDLLDIKVGLFLPNVHAI